MKEEIKNPQNSMEYTIQEQWKLISCRKNTANENSSIIKTDQNRLKLWSNCDVCGKKKSWFIKNQ